MQSVTACVILLLIMDINVAVKFTILNCKMVRSEIHVFYIYNIMTYTALIVDEYSRLRTAEWHLRLLS